MKIIIHFLFMSLILVAGCNQQSVNPTPQVLGSFESKFGRNISPKWELSSDNLYVADFTLSGHPARSYFNTDGKWIKTETELLSSELPSVIVRTVLGAYRDYSITKSVKIDEGEKETIYRLSLKRGNKTTEVELTSAGVILGTPGTK
jgi:hypothetical protein